MGTDRLLTQSHTVRQQEKKVIKALFFGKRRLNPTLLLMASAAM
jgi:hypothetical protein